MCSFPSNLCLALYILNLRTTVQCNNRNSSFLLGTWLYLLITFGPLVWHISHYIIGKYFQWQGGCFPFLIFFSSLHKRMIIIVWFHLLIETFAFTALFFQLPSGAPALESVLSLGGHKAPVVTVDWCSAVDCGTCLTASMDGKIKLSTLLAQKSWKRVFGRSQVL